MASDGHVSRFNNVEYTAAHERMLASIDMLPAAAGEPFSVRPGRRLGSNGLTVTVGGSPEKVTTSPGAGVVYSSAQSAAGAYAFAIPAAVETVLPARPATGQSRIDLVVARIYDVDETIGAAREVKIEHVPGAPSGSPAAPALPGLSIELARLSVPATGSISVTASTSRAVAAGAIVPVVNDADRSTLPAYRGLVVDNAATGKLQRYNGTAWVNLAEEGSVDDTGWVDLAFTTDYSAYDTAQFGVPGVRRVGSLVMFRGAVQKTSGSFSSGNNGVATVPAGSGLGFRVTQRMDFQVAGSTSTNAKVLLTTSGSLAVFVGSPIPSYASLADLSYFVG